MGIPKITIVTVVKDLVKNNRIDTFLQCVESVQNQTYPCIEHLVIDGASTDGTSKTLKNCCDKGLIKYISEPDFGIYDAMNKGLKMAEGEYVLFLNSDDFLHDREGIQRCIVKLEKEKADFSYGPCRLLTKEGKEYGFLSPRLGLFYWTIPFSHQTFLAKKNLLIKQGGFNLKYKIASDWDLIIKVILTGAQPCFENYSFVTFRRGGISEQSQTLLNKERFQLIEDNFSKYFNEGDIDLLKKLILPKYVYNEIEKIVHPKVKKAMFFWNIVFPQIFRETVHPIVRNVLNIWRSVSLQHIGREK